MGEPTPMATPPRARPASRPQAFPDATPARNSADTSAVTDLPPLLIAFTAVGAAFTGVFVSATVSAVPAGLCPLRDSAALGLAVTARLRTTLLVLTNIALWEVALLGAYFTLDALPIVPTLWLMSSSCLALWLIDVRHHRLPNAIVYSLYPLIAGALVFAGVTSAQWRLGQVLGSTALWAVFFGVVYIASLGKGMGLGDVKFAPVLGAVLGWFGWGASIFGLLAAFVVGGFFSLALLLLGRSRRQAIPFGPFMMIGALIGLLVGSIATEWYLAA